MLDILISHGSGGIGSAEKFIANYFSNLGYNVHFNDFFKKYQINKLNWSEQDSHTHTFKDMYDINVPRCNYLVHIGISFGTFFGFLNNDKFIKNFGFYPSVQGINQHMIEQDYSNCTMFLAEHDVGIDRYSAFAKLCNTPPSKEYIIPNTHHGFMIDKIDIEFDKVKYDLVGKVMSDVEFNKLLPNHAYMSSQYEYKLARTRLKSNNHAREHCLKIIENQIKDLENHLT